MIECLLYFLFSDLSTLRFFYNLGHDVSSEKSDYTYNVIFFTVRSIHTIIVYNNYSNRCS
jgi:hypothetical protein